MKRKGIKIALIVAMVGMPFALALSAGANSAVESDLIKGSDTYMILVDSADNYIKAERWHDAEETIKAALRLEPANFTNALLLQNLGVVQTNQGKLQDAIESFSIGLGIAPNSTVLLTNRAYLLLEMGNVQSAVADLSKSLTVDPSLQRPRKLRGYISLQQGDLTGAMADFNKLKEYYPNDCDAIVGLAECALADGDSKKALELYSEALSKNPSADMYLSRGLIYANEGRLTEAMADAKSGLAIDSESPELYILCAYIHKLNYRNEESEADIKLAIRNGADSQMIRKYFPERKN